MGALEPGVKAAERPLMDSLRPAFKSLCAAERGRHEAVLSYWHSVRGDKEFPPLHDLDPLELSDAGPSSILMELISGGHDAEIRHLGEALREEAWPERIVEAPNPSVLSCIARKLPIVAISRDSLSFEDEYETSSGRTRCSVTLLPLSAGGAWVDYVYAFVSVEAVEPGSDLVMEADSEDPATEASAQSGEIHRGSDDIFIPDAEEEPLAPHAPECDDDASSGAYAVGELDAPDEGVRGDEFKENIASAEAEERGADSPTKAAPGFSKLLDSLAGLTGFYGSQPVKVEPAIASDPSSEIEPVPVACTQSSGQSEAEVAGEGDELERDEPTGAREDATETQADVASFLTEGSLQDKLSRVRAKADDARMARQKADSALYEGLGAAYDFALDAENAPEEYLRLVEGQGLKIQLRSPMKPVVKLAFAGVCDEPTIKQLEAVLAWAFDEELPRGTLAERIEAAGGIEAILRQ